MTQQECLQVTGAIKEDLKTIRVALVGNDMRGGIVKDVADLKKERSYTVQTLKSVVLPVVLAVVTYWILNRF